MLVWTLIQCRIFAPVLHILCVHWQPELLRCFVKPIRCSVHYYACQPFLLPPLVGSGRKRGLAARRSWQLGFLAPPPVAVDIGEALLFCIARFSFIINYGLSQKLQTGFILLILALRALRKISGSSRSTLILGSARSFALAHDSVAYMK